MQDQTLLMSDGDVVQWGGVICLLVGCLGACLARKRPCVPSCRHEVRATEYYYNPALVMQKQEEHKFKIILGYRSN